MKTWIYAVIGVLLAVVGAVVGIVGDRLIGEMSFQECELKYLPAAQTEYGARRMSHACSDIYKRHKDLAEADAGDSDSPRFERITVDEVVAMRGGQGEWDVSETRALSIGERVSLYFKGIRTETWEKLGAVVLLVVLFALAGWLFRLGYARYHRIKRYPFL